MSLQKIKTKVFETKAEATLWAKEEKQKLGPQAGVKWETNRLNVPTKMKWEAVLYKSV